MNDIDMHMRRHAHETCTRDMYKIKRHVSYAQEACTWEDMHMRRHAHETPMLEMRPPVHVLLCCVQVTQLTAQFDDIQSSAHEASEMMEGEQMEKREMEEKLQETMVRYLYHFQRVLVLTPPHPPSPHRHESQNFLGSMNSCTCRLLR